MNALKSVGTLAMNAFKSISWGTVGKAVITGIANGITGAAGAIVTAAKNAAKKALDAAKNFLGIHSPSTVFRDQVGKNMALGVGLGFEKNVPEDFILKRRAASGMRCRRISVMCFPRLRRRNSLLQGSS